MVQVETIKFSEAKAGDILLVPNLTRGAELAVVEIKAIYAGSFEAKGITGMIPTPKAETVVRILTQRHPLRIEVFKK